MKQPLLPFDAAPDHRPGLEKAQRLLESFRIIDGTMPLQIATTFLLCARYEGSSVGEIARRGGYAMSTASRHILDLGEFDRNKKPGYRLVETRIDPKELRRKTVHLTARGRSLVQQIVSLV